MNGHLHPLRGVWRVALLCIALGSALFAQAAWRLPLPFGLDPDGTNKPPRLHRLLEKANDYIELAEDEALAGEGDKAIENYRLALAELDRVEEEHPERAESPEFAPLRNKRATCTAAIDAIRFAQINENARAVSLTNTKDLERRWRKKHGLETPEDLEEARQEEARKKAKKAEGKESEEKKVEAEKSEEKKPEPEQPEKAGDSGAVAVPFAERRAATLAHLRKQEYAAADALLVTLEKERPEELGVLLLRAASQMGQDQNHAARRTLEKAMKAHPKSYLPCYNLATVTLRLGEPPLEARFYYEKGRALGGPRNKELEEKLK